jgi:hypothetical protein
LIRASDVALGNVGAKLLLIINDNAVREVWQIELNFWRVLYLAARTTSKLLN